MRPKSPDRSGFERCLQNPMSRLSSLLLLLLLVGLLIPVATRASSVGYLAYPNLFVNSANNGANPQSALVLGSDGVTLFGTTLL